MTPSAAKAVALTAMLPRRIRATNSDFVFFISSPPFVFVEKLYAQSICQVTLILRKHLWIAKVRNLWSHRNWIAAGDGENGAECSTDVERQAFTSNRQCRGARRLQTMCVAIYMRPTNFFTSTTATA